MNLYILENDGRFTTVLASTPVITGAIHTKKLPVHGGVEAKVSEYEEGKQIYKHTIANNQKGKLHNFSFIKTYVWA